MIRSISKLRGTVSFNRAFSQKTPKTPKQPKATPNKEESMTANVPGLSSNVIKKRSEPLGPGASATGEYKVPEYYCYDRFSFHESEVEMAKYRCPQPDAQRK